MNLDLATVGPWLLAALLGVDRIAVAIRSLMRLKHDGEEALEGYITERQLQERFDSHRMALIALAAKADQILAWVTPNGGGSIPDALDKAAKKLDIVEATGWTNATVIRALEAKLDAHIAESMANAELLHQLKARLDAHIALNLDGPPPGTAP